MLIVQQIVVACSEIGAVKKNLDSAPTRAVTPHSGDSAQTRNAVFNDKTVIYHISPR